MKYLSECYNQTATTDSDEATNLASLFESCGRPSELTAKKQNPSALPEFDQYEERAWAASSSHTLHCGDAKDLSWIADSSVHRVVTSPPYWNLKKYSDGADQMGDIADYENFLDELDKVWEHAIHSGETARPTIRNAFPAP